MSKTKVTSIRLDADLLEKASAFGLNISKICEVSVRNELRKSILREDTVIPEGIRGLGKGSRIIMSNMKFKDIRKIRVGDRVLSVDFFTGKSEEANVLDVGVLTSREAFATSITIKAATGPVIELLPETLLCCWRNGSSGPEWIAAKNIRVGFVVSLRSCKSSGGSTLVENVEENHVRDVFYRLEVYPNNNFFANSSTIRRTHYVNDYMSAVWAFPVKGYLGQIKS
jgi:hypothetical protein